ncbi:MAG: hypothetical protein CTY35_00580 [Methylotenera sp.]|uniref:AAA family ATPase n=1 Tax=Methylotenera sp. TaxID=2051956 RepID=UPI000D49906F|nr:AAA family ATPase [Methylotenera sp.]PPC84851.1 MAG: hypothetical protein CTY38_00575 [Methylotenera sp.]PPD02211.1 MAG: hypothetical protein CTY35_00580 [Methylotenera sp.]
MVEVIASQRLMYLMAKTNAESNANVIFDLVRKIRELHAAGADLDYINEDDGLSVLGVAIRNGHESTLKVLFDLGCNMNNPVQGQHPLLFASECRPDMVVPLAINGSGKGLEEKVLMTLLDEVRKSDGIDHDDMKELSVALFGDSVDLNQREHVLYNHVFLKTEQDREKNEGRRHFIKLLAEKGPYRKYSKTPMVNALDDLAERFPNFEQVIAHIVRQISLSNLSSNSIMMLSPILLYGAPGLGKTRFVRELANLMQMEFGKINCGAVTAGWVISGSSTSWQEGRPGMVHTTMRDGTTANPIIMLDEIDKLSGDSRFNAFGSLYELLEDTTAREFTDEAVMIPIDCSKVSWIATANDTSVIPEAILSRMKMIEVFAPDKTQIKSTIRSIMHDIIQENIDSWGSLFNPEISEEVMLLLSDYSPRDIRNMIKDAMGEAAANRKCDIYNLEERDFISLRKRARKIGF